MPRPPRRRCIRGIPPAVYYKPQGVPLRQLGEAVLGLDELEALRLADLEGLSQEAGGERMGVSRATFGRIVEAARRKTARALVNGLALRIEGGPVRMADMRVFVCFDCNHRWSVPFGGGRPPACPACGGPNLRREVPDGAAAPPPGCGPGPGRGRRRGMGRGRRGQA